MAAQPKFTPGPWRPVLHPNGARAAWPLDVVEEATDASILHECVGSATANARLIAAAPDLYAALSALTEALNSKFVHVEATKQMAPQLEAAEAQARVALRKAEGDAR